MGWSEGPVRVRVPATSANLGPGFDTLGLALSLHDVVEARVTPDGLSIDVSGEGAAYVAGAGEKHLVVQAMRAAFDDLGGGQPPGLALRCVNGIPHGRGLGSSAAAIVAGVLAARALAGAGLAAADALPLASALEGHPDNVAPCLLGGLTIAWTAELGDSPAAQGRAVAQPGAVLGDSPAAQGRAAAQPGAVLGDSPAAQRRAAAQPGAVLGDSPAAQRRAAAQPGGSGGSPPRIVRAIRLEPLAEITPVAIVAPAPVSTELARGLLPGQVPHADAARNAGRAALLVAALTARPDALLDATEDWLHQDYRAPAMPATHDLVGRLRAAGLPAVVSGAGPSVLVLLTSAHGLDRLDSTVKETGIDWHISPLDVERQGASVAPGTREPGDAGQSSPGRLNPFPRCGWLQRNAVGAIGVRLGEASIAPLRGGCWSSTRHLGGNVYLPREWAFGFTPGEHLVPLSTVPFDIFTPAVPETGRAAGQMLGSGADAEHRCERNHAQ